MKKSIIALSFIQNISNLLTSLPSRRLSSKLWPIPRHGFHDITRSFPLQTLLTFFLISSVQFVRNLAISPSDSRECHFSARSRPWDKQGGAVIQTLKGKIRESGGRGVVPQFFFRPFGPQFGLKITEGGGGPLAGSAAAFPFSFPPEIG